MHRFLSGEPVASVGHSDMASSARRGPDRKLQLEHDVDVASFCGGAADILSKMAQVEADRSDQAAVASTNEPISTKKGARPKGKAKGKAEKAAGARAPRAEKTLPEGEKMCKECKQKKPADEFNADQANCKACFNDKKHVLDLWQRRWVLRGCAKPRSASHRKWSTWRNHLGMRRRLR